MKIKSMRENLRESHMLKDYLEKFPRSRAHVLLEQRRNPSVTYEPMRNYLDVSVTGAGAPERPLGLLPSTVAPLKNTELGLRFLKSERVESRG